MLVNEYKVRDALIVQVKDPIAREMEDSENLLLQLTDSPFIEFSKQYSKWHFRKEWPRLNTIILSQCSEVVKFMQLSYSHYILYLTDTKIQ